MHFGVIIVKFPEKCAFILHNSSKIMFMVWVITFVEVVKLRNGAEQLHLAGNWQRMHPSREHDAPRKALPHLVIQLPDAGGFCGFVLHIILIKTIGYVFTDNTLPPAINGVFDAAKQFADGKRTTTHDAHSLCHKNYTLLRVQARC